MTMYGHCTFYCTFYSQAVKLGCKVHKGDTPIGGRRLLGGKDFGLPVVVAMGAD